MAAVPTVPAEKVLTKGERLWYWIATNRTKIGTLVLSLSALVRVSMTFRAHSEVADTLKAVSDLFIAGGLAGLTAGATHGDEHYAAKKEQIVSARSGEYPAFTGEAKNEQP